MINNDADFSNEEYYKYWFYFFISNIYIISVKTLVDFLIEEVDWFSNQQKLTFLLTYNEYLRLHVIAVTDVDCETNPGSST
jgi:hypothetical protein